LTTTFSADVQLLKLLFTEILHVEKPISQPVEVVYPLINEALFSGTVCATAMDAEAAAANASPTTAPEIRDATLIAHPPPYRYTTITLA
jgi:hypothetical protein